MKRLHVNVAVADLDASTRFYTSLFGSEPAVRKSDYAKWLLDDPRVNFAITAHGTKKGVDHLGIQVDSREELADLSARFVAAEAPLLEQGTTTCCYAHSEKSWSTDPDGIAWEAFRTFGENGTYGDRSRSVTGEADICCASGTAAAAVSKRCCAVSAAGSDTA